MPIFEYVALNHRGKKIKHTLSADSIETAKDVLRKQKTLVTSICPIKRHNFNIKLPLSIKLNITRQIAQLLRSGLPLYESLLILEEKIIHQKYHFLFIDLCDRVRQGSALSQALACYERSFDKIYVSMVAAGEESGSLAEVFEELSIMIEKEQRLKKKLSSAMIYPAFLGIFCCIVIFSMFFFLIPSLRELFNGKNLHPLTKSVLGISSFLQEYKIYLFLGLILVNLFVIIFIQTKDGKNIIQKTSLKLPFIKTLIIYAVITRFSKTMAALLKNGVPLISALKLSKEVMQHHMFIKIIDDTVQQIVKGEKLSAQLAKHKIIPSLIPRMLATSEQSGKSSEMFAQIAKIYEEDLEKNIEQFIQLLQPVLILFLGLIVGFVILSIMLPLTDVSSFLN
ncbi:MAG: type II secretion system F family protein [Chlamydiales bacterium]|nr:type II secretion system F family protein [Chlamydiales bacterium]